METIEELCKRKGYEYRLQTKKALIENGSYNFFRKHFIQTVHKNTLLLITYDIENHNVATVSFKLRTNNHIPSITINTTENIFNLFFRKKLSWKVKPKDAQLNDSILEKLSIHGLTKLMIETSFSPTMRGKTEVNYYEFNTYYNLCFDEKIEQLENIINFHKVLIDILQSRYNIKSHQ